MDSCYSDSKINECPYPLFLWITEISVEGTILFSFVDLTSVIHHQWLALFSAQVKTISEITLSHSIGLKIIRKFRDLKEVKTTLTAVSVDIPLLLTVVTLYPCVCWQSSVFNWDNSLPTSLFREIKIMWKLFGGSLYLEL